MKVPGDFETDYEPLSDARMAEIVTSLHHRRRLPDDAHDPSPLAASKARSR